MALYFRPFWLTAEQEEWHGLWKRNCFKVWKRSDFAANDRVFTSRYVYKLKRDAISGKVSQFKARLIVQDFKMQQDVNDNDTFSPTPGSTVTRTIISIAIAEDLELHSVDFTSSFIQANRRQWQIRHLAPSRLSPRQHLWYCIQGSLTPLWCPLQLARPSQNT